MFLQDAWEKRIKRNLVRQRMVVPTLFKGKFFSTAVSVFQFRTLICQKWDWHFEDLASSQVPSWQVYSQKLSISDDAN